MLLPTACDDDIKTFDTDMIEIPGNSGAIWVKDQGVSQDDLKQAIEVAHAAKHTGKGANL